jgi:small conductance mechanosensitive channel
MDWQAIMDQWSLLINIGIILLVAVAVRLGLKLAAKRIVKSIVSGVKIPRRSQKIEKIVNDQRLTQRTKTIASVLDNVATWVIAITALVMILSEFGVNVGALIAVSTILGAAIGFGSQSLVKDILAGIFIVFEDQYGVGDWVDLDGASGEVERVGLRITELRDIHGALWFIRNGEILRVGNSSQEWAKALLDLPFAYDNDVDEVQSIIIQVAKELEASEKFGKDITEEVEIQGMMHFSGEQFVIRVALKTLPNRQWAVSRELRRRLKNAFDANGITLLQASKINLAK